jgi:hypothetical protein
MMAGDKDINKDGLAMPIDREESLFAMSEEQHARMVSTLRRQFLQERRVRRKGTLDISSMSAKEYAEHFLGESLTESEFQPSRPSLVQQKRLK